MTITDADNLIVRPTLDWMGPRYGNLKAELLLLAIGYQETGFKTRVQDGGPARGFWQFEGKTGAAGIFANDPRMKDFRAMAKALHYPTDVAGFMKAIGSGADKLACIAARGLLWLDPMPLPEMSHDGAQAAWDYYVHNWEPGKPSKTRWFGPNGSYKRAQAVIFPVS